MSTFEDVTKKIMNWFNNHSVINEVTFGDENEVDISKATTLPLVHIQAGRTLIRGGAKSLSYTILILNKYNPATDDKIEVISKMGEVGSQFISNLNTGVFDSLTYILMATAPEMSVVYDKFQNRLYGYQLEVIVTVPAELIC